MGNIDLKNKLPILKKSGLKINEDLIDDIESNNNIWNENLFWTDQKTCIYCL